MRWDLYVAVMLFFVIDVVDVNEAVWQLPCEQRERDDGRSLIRCCPASRLRERLTWIKKNVVCINSTAWMN